jgi:AcrR family transcriptional regulator
MKENMNMSSPGLREPAVQPTGLRERKKRKTRWAIQEHALRLFAEQGYDATTVDQIAAAAEISPSTFFRYFKTKEDVVIEDEYDELMVKGMAALAPDVPPITALRQVMRAALEAMGHAEQAKLRERTRLIMAVPALRARSLDNFLGTIALISTAVAARTGRDPRDVEVRSLAGAVVGAALGVLELWFDSDGTGDIAELIDQALAHLEAGLPL